MPFTVNLSLEMTAVCLLTTSCSPHDGMGQTLGVHSVPDESLPVTLSSVPESPLTLSDSLEWTLTLIPTASSPLF